MKVRIIYIVACWLATLTYGFTQSADLTDLLGNEIEPDNDLIEFSGSVLESGASYMRLTKSSLIVERNDEVQKLLTRHQTGGVKLDDYEVLGVLEDPKGHRFEIGKLRLPNDEIYLSLTAWSKYNDGPARKEVEYIDPYDGNLEKMNLRPIHAKRKNWVDYSNDHNPEKLVESTYHRNGYYLSSGRIRMGADKIIEAYQYMKRPNWSIELIPQHIHPVHENLIYEVGRYESTGTGSYLLIWTKDDQGDWKILLDFNF